MTAGWNIVAYWDRDKRLWKARGDGWQGPNGEYITSLDGLDYGRGPLTVAAVDDLDALVNELGETSGDLITLLDEVDRLTARLGTASQRATLAGDALMVIGRHLLGVSRRCPTHDTARVDDCGGCDQAQRVEQATHLAEQTARAVGGQPVPA